MGAPKDVDNKPVIVEKWDLSSLRVALEDATKEYYVQKYNLVESFRLFDGRLLLCTICVLTAGVCILYDYLYPHPLSRNVLIVCIAIYFVFSFLTTLYILYVEKNIFLVAKKEDKTGLDPPDTWYVSSNMKKYDPIFRLILSITDGKTKQTKVSFLEKCASEFFSTSGELQKAAYNKFLDNLYVNVCNEKKTL